MRKSLTRNLLPSALFAQEDILSGQGESHLWGIVRAYAGENREEFFSPIINRFVTHL